MNEKLNLVEILKDCTKGTKLYSTVLGEVEFEGINDIIGPIIVTTDTGNAECFTADGKMYNYYNGECLLFPSKEQRDWSKFKTKKPKFDPKTLQPFDKVLARYTFKGQWRCTFYSHERKDIYKYVTTDYTYKIRMPLLLYLKGVLFPRCTEYSTYIRY